MLRNKAYRGYNFRIVVEIMVAIFLLPNFGIVGAQTGNPNNLQTQLQDTLQISGRLETNGTHFELKNSSYLNITLDSSEPIKLTIESPPEMVTMQLESLAIATTTNIIMRGFAPQTTYQKYEDDYHNLVTFTTDDSGSYAYMQDLSKSHFVFIQPRPSTRFINAATGGDCLSMGTWDPATRTCALTTDVYETIQIDSSNIILDGNGHTVTGNGTGFGVYLIGKVGVTIKNLNVRNFSGGIYLYDADWNNIVNNTVSNNYDGIYLGGMPFGSTNNNFIGNKASKNTYGIHLDMINMKNNLAGNNASNNFYGIFMRLSSNNSLTGNTMAGNKYNFDIFTNNIYNGDIYHNIDTSNLVDGKPIYYVKNAVGQVYDASTNAGTFFCINCDNVTIKGLTLTKNGAGVVLWKTNNSRIENIQAMDNTYGIYLGESGNNNLTGNNASNNGDRGIYLTHSNNNDITANNASNNIFAGIEIDESNNNNLAGNTANSNDGGYGIRLANSNNDTLTGNYASGNGDGISLSTNNSTLMSNIMSGNMWNFGIFIMDNYLDNNIDTSNLVDGKPIYYVKNAVDKVYDASTNAGTFYCITCDNVTIKGLTLNKNSAGVFLWKTNNSRIEDIQAADNAYGFVLEKSGNNSLTDNIALNSFQGIVLKGSSNNNLTGNNISNSEYYGIISDRYSNSNLIYNNYFNNSYSIHHAINAYDAGNNTWNITKKDGTNILGGSWLGGNYWSDYAGNDINEDGLGDTLLPYNSTGGIRNGGDYLPLVHVSVTIPILKSITVSPSTTTLNINEIRYFNATAMDQTGAPMSGIIITWTSSDMAIGTVFPENVMTGADGNATTTFMAIAAGIAMVNATNGSVVGSAQVIVNEGIEEINLIKNSCFESGRQNWIFYTNGTGRFNIISPGFEGDNAAEVRIMSGGSNIQLYQKEVTLKPDTHYRLSFAAKSSRGHDLRLSLLKHGSPYTNYGLAQRFDLNTNWQTFTIEFVTKGFTKTVNDGRLMFNLAQFAKAGDYYYFDSVKLEEVP